MLIQVKKMFPVSLNEITAEHQKISNMASSEFMKRSFKDEEQKYFKKLTVSSEHIPTHKNKQTYILQCQSWAQFSPVAFTSQKYYGRMIIGLTILRFSKICKQLLNVCVLCDGLVSHPWIYSYFVCDVPRIHSISKTTLTRIMW